MAALGIARGYRSAGWWTLAAGVVAVAFGLSLTVGPSMIPPSTVVRTLVDAIGLDVGPVEPTHRAIVTAIRLPRAVLAMLVGASLAVAGALTQGLFRNPLADPTLIGLSGGAAAAAGVTIIVSLRFGAEVLSIGLVPLGALLGAWLTALVVFRFGVHRGITSVAALLLAGIAVNAMCMAFLGLLTFLADDQELRTIQFWMLGSLAGGSASGVLVLVAVVVGPLIMALRLAPDLDALSLGEAEAGHLGVSVESVKRQIMLWVSVLVGASVALCGVISFVGLCVPHVVRLLGRPHHGWVLPGSIALGAVLMMLADVVARVVVAPAELPIGIVTALLGAPFFLSQLSRLKGGE